MISLQADGEPFGQGAGYVAATEDGSAVVFRVSEALYERREGMTTEIATAGNFAGLATDGGRVLYTAGGDLFACDVEAGPCAGPAASQAPIQIAADSIFISVSPDGSHVLFSSKDVLTGAEENENCEEPLAGEVECEAAEAGANNLYAWDAATTRFLGVLDPQDFVDFGGINNVVLNRWTEAASEEGGGNRATSPTRATPDGEVFVFQSHARLTSYDNTGPCGHEGASARCGEVYRYDPAAAAGERLVCLSCDPTGTPPSAEATLQDLRAQKPAAIRGTLIAERHRRRHRGLLPEL